MTHMFRSMRPLVILAILACSADVHACPGSLGFNAMIGPLLGIRLGGHPGSRLVVGVEGGFGCEPERVDLGFEHRDRKLFGYLEMDPWFGIGGSLGVGVDSDANWHPVLGVWEGLPIVYPPCGSASSWKPIASIAIGYRFTGVHELYVTAKAGTTNSTGVCLGS